MNRDSLSLLRLFIQIQGRPPEFSSGPAISWRNVTLPTINLCSPPVALDISFERLAAELQHFPRMYFELDGSFVWTGSLGGSDWQLDGMVYDCRGQVQYVEVKGHLPYSAWLPLTTALGRERQPHIAHLVDQGAFVDLQVLEQVLWNAS